MKIFILVLLCAGFFIFSTTAMSQPQVDKTNEPIVPTSENAIAKSTRKSFNKDQINIPISDNPPITVQFPATDHRTRVFNPSLLTGTLRGNEPSMAPVVQAELNNF